MAPSSTPTGDCMPESLPERLRENLPLPLLQLRRLVLWKAIKQEGKKPRKIPFYLNGLARGGTKSHPIPLGSKEDISLLSDLDGVRKVWRPSVGVGFALLEEDGIGAFDLDNCLTPDGTLILSHPGASLVNQAKEEGAYIEITPSGRGLRILGASSDPRSYSKDQLEYWTHSRYVTLTGKPWANPKGWTNITKFRSALKSEEEPNATSEPDYLITSKLLSDLRSALGSMSSDNRELWVRMGMALKPLGEKGWELWRQWSAKSSKFDPVDAEVRWESFRPSKINPQSVFFEAANNWGWDNPYAKRGQEEEEGPKSLLSLQVPLGDQQLYPTEFILDGFLPTGVSLVAGAGGSGKTTNLIPLFASVAHLTPEEWGFWPQIRRKVVWVTEAVDQSRDILYSLSVTPGSADWERIKEWFYLIPARRRAPARLAELIRRAIPELTYTQSPNGFKVNPVIILDTTSANLDLENESDNSEVGAALAAFKEALPGIPLVLVGHTPKALLKADISDLTFRGAGAWEADAVATYYMVYDPELGSRTLAIRKHRFRPSYTEVSFGEAKSNLLIDTPWGEPQDKVFIHGIPCKSSTEERENAKKAVRDAKRDEAREEGLSLRQQRILEVLENAILEGRITSRAFVKESLGGKAELVSEALDRLIEQGKVELRDVPEELNRGRGRRVSNLLFLAGFSFEGYVRQLVR